MLRLDGIRKSFGEHEVLRGISLSVEKGESAVLCGASGSGKTTLMRIAAGLEKPDDGTVICDSRPAVVFPEPRLFARASVLENVTCVMRGAKEENRERAIEILGALGLSDACTLYPRELSSGMASRVSLARAIAFDAELYLLDEPFGRLDGEMKRSVMTYMKHFLSEKTALIITHDPAEAAFMGSAIYDLSDGRILKRSEYSEQNEIPQR